LAPDWDEDSPRLRKNLAQVLGALRRSAKERTTPSVEQAREWQHLFMKGLEADDAKYVGAFRGEPGLENVQVRIGTQYGVPADSVSEELRKFQVKLQEGVGMLDEMLPPGQALAADQLGAVIVLCAWAHSEWVRIHPFANGNGRTARLWANSIAMRYGLPPFVRLRPRPDGGYGTAGAQAMLGNWEPTATVFHKMLNDLLNELESHESVNEPSEGPDNSDKE
jgi:hypothetical protein